MTKRRKSSAEEKQNQACTEPATWNWRPTTCEERDRMFSEENLPKLKPIFLAVGTKLREKSPNESSFAVVRIPKGEILNEEIIYGLELVATTKPPRKYRQRKRNRSSLERRTASG